MYCYRKDLPSTSTTSGTRVKLILTKKWIKFQEEKASREEDMRCSSLQWVRWMMNMVWRKLHAIWRNQGSRHTRILGNAFKIRYFGAILKLAQEKGLQIYQTRSHAVVLYNTLLAACIEKAVCMKTQDELYQKVRLTPRVTRVVLKLNSQFGHQDLQSQDARSSWEPSSDSKSYGETCNNTVDNKISGVPLSLQSSSRIQHARTRSRGWSRSSRTTNIRNHSFRTWARRRTTSSAKNRRIQHHDLRTLRKFFQTAMSSLQCLLKSSRRSNRVRPEKAWRHLNPWKCD